MGSNTIIAIVVGAILVIVGFSLWPVLNGASNSALLLLPGQSCDDGNGNRFLRVYTGVNGGQPYPVRPSTTSTPERRTGARDRPFERTTAPTCARLVTIGNSPSPVLTTAQGATGSSYIQRARRRVGTQALPVLAGLAAEYSWTTTTATSKSPPCSRGLQGINNLLLTIIPVVSIAGFLGISGAKLYSYGKGTASIGSSISTSIFTLIGIVVAMVIAGPIMGSCGGC